jgi:hypothetical protein
MDRLDQRQVDQLHVHVGEIPAERHDPRSGGGGIRDVRHHVDVTFDGDPLRRSSRPFEPFEPSAGQVVAARCRSARSIHSRLRAWVAASTTGGATPA